MTDDFLRVIEKKPPGTDWIVIVLVIITGITAMVRILYPRFLSRLFQAFSSTHESIRLLTERNVRTQQASAFMLVCAVLSLALFAVIFVDKLDAWSLDMHPAWMYLGFVGGCAFAIFIRYALIFWLGSLFRENQVAARINQIWLINIQILGIVMLVVSFVAAFVSLNLDLWILRSGFLILFLWGIYLIFREIQALARTRVSLLFRILYLCAFEILPWWWLILTIKEGWS